ncbi:unnamed protein product [Blepharisma stoltei]|uniref:non-specific serine/threonine protein kinase n=1 Tax=Blepharisma stoltei TaxID=1481888 RepID=A0AAU9JKB9_9CILI|nr:unnamed protein product [Blepharisma stoltei]
MGVCCPKEYKMLRPKTARQLDKPEISNSSRLERINTRYEFIKVIGCGQFGTVREARMVGYDIENNCKHFAIKSINKVRVMKNLKLMKNEISILMLVDHPNIIKLYETYEDDMYIHLVMELCTGGDLFEHLMVRGSLTELEVAQIMRKIFTAVNHLHNINICHRDIKPENFLVSSKDNDADIKMIDFGMSAKFGGEEMNTIVGTPYYLAPEVLRGSYGLECDVWSLGVVMFFLLVGQQPFKGDSLNEIFQKIVKADFDFSDPSWEIISDEAKILISKMLIVNPDYRISLQDALSHEWFVNNLSNSHQEIKLEVFKSIKRYRAPSKLWHEAMKILVQNLSADQIKELQSAFLEIDQRKTGFVTAKDIEAAMIRNGFFLARDEFKALVQSINYVGKGKLNYTQFLIASVDKRRALDEESMWLVFKHFDLDRNGTISVDELKFALEKAGCYLSDTEYKEIIDEFELKAGETMNFEEFKEIMLCFEDRSLVCTEQEDQFVEAPRRGMRRLSQRLLMQRKTIIEPKKKKRVTD